MSSTQPPARTGAQTALMANGGYARIAYEQGVAPTGSGSGGRFCSSCGRAMSPSARSCDACGAAVG